jgi:hypothetical protein
VTTQKASRAVLYLITILPPLLVAIYAYTSGVMVVVFGMLLVLGGAISGLIRKDMERRKTPIGASEQYVHRLDRE